MLSLKRKLAKSNKWTNETGRLNELVLVLPDGRRCRVMLAYVPGYRGFVQVGVDAPRDVVVLRGELDAEGGGR